MSTLSIEKRAEVARAVTKIPYEVVGLNTILSPAHTDTQWQRYWFPSFSDQDGRLQALALVEWLADRIEKMPAGARRFNRLDSFLIALTQRDTAALESLCSELLSEQV